MIWASWIDLACQTTRPGKQDWPVPCTEEGHFSESDTPHDGQNGGNVKRITKIVAQGLAHNPAQRWYYFPKMLNSEVLVFRQYSTMHEPLNLRTVFHTAAADPSSPPRRYA